MRKQVQWREGDRCFDGKETTFYQEGISMHSFSDNLELIRA